MTVRLLRFGGTDWGTGEGLIYLDQNDTLNNIMNEAGFNKYDEGTSGVTIGKGLLRHSASIWVSTSARTTNSGGTWSSGGFGQVDTEDIAGVSGATAVSVHQDDGSVAYTDDSSANWQAASVGPPNITKGACVHMFSTTFGVIGGKAGAGVLIWFTSDSGDNWTQATSGPTGAGGFAVNAIVMCSANIGYAIDNAGDIWKTTNAGVDWTDTTDNTTTTPGNLFAISTDEVFYTTWSGSVLYHYKNSTNTVKTIFSIGLTGSGVGTSNIIQATNGNYYVVVASGGDAVNAMTSNLTLFRYDGTDIYQKNIGLGSKITPADDMKIAGDPTGTVPTLIEAADNTLVLNMNGKFTTMNFIE